MVRCAMCKSFATITFHVDNYGEINVCDIHYQYLGSIETQKEKMKDILTRILNALNKEFIETESYMGMPPMKRGKYMGKREGLKIAIGEVETELERLIKK